MLRTTWLLPALLAGSAHAQEATYVQEGGWWQRVEGTRTHRVDPRTVTVRASREHDVVATLARLQGPLAGARLVRENRLGFRDVRVPEGRDVMEFVTGLRATGLFESVEENTIGHFSGGTCSSSITPSFADQWGLENTGQTGGFVDADVDALSAWAIEDGDPGITVAIIDSGTTWTHEDLVGNVWENTAEVLDGTDTDLNGYVDDIRGWDFNADDNEPEGLYWHGTAVAGVVAARGQNGVGIEGIAGGYNDGVGAKVMVIKVGNFVPLSDPIDDAILYAVDNGADVINMSLGVSQSSAIDAALDAAEAAGVLVVCASGDTITLGIDYPASYVSTVAVTSSTHIDIVSNISDFGDEVDVSAPGELVPVLDLGETDYYLACGSSFASPLVSGIAALLLSVKESMTNDELREFIFENTDDIELPGEDVFSGAGRINAGSSLIELTTGFAKVYGPGTPGTPGVPGMAAAAPVIGATSTITTSNALVGAFGALSFSTQRGSFPFAGGTLNIHPAGMSNFLVVVDGSGNAMRSFALPNDTAFLGRTRYMQWLILDAGAPGGLAMSSGIEVRIGLP